MAGGGDMCHYSVDYARSPLKTPINNVVNPSKNIHTFAIDVGDGQCKGSYKMARNKHVVDIHEMFKPVQEATKTL